MKNQGPETLTVIIISYNTKDLTLRAIETLLETTKETNFKVIVFDNASSDGSAQAIAEAFPNIELELSDDNIGFAAANNHVAERVYTPWMLLLNPDTECHPGAIDSLMAFAREQPLAGIWGGRTVFPDGTLNIASCWMQITLWSLFCRTFGLSHLLNSSPIFNSEAIGGWKRNSVREVDIVVGCLMLIETDLWRQLRGFDLKYFMYGEESDLCLRAKKLGYSPMVTPDAQIMHLVGAASSKNFRRQILVLKARATLIRDHWPTWRVPLGLSLMWLGAILRAVYGSKIIRARARKESAAMEIWQARRDWLSGY